MKKKLYVVFDKVAEEAMPIFEGKNDGVAWRKFADVRDKTEGIRIEDFDLYRVGSFDTETMVLEGDLKLISESLHLVEEIEDAKGI